jgi:hypothetical protein
MPRHLKVFVSSPGDVRAERTLVATVLDELQKDHAWRGDFTFQVFRWDDDDAATAMDARQTPQESVEEAIKPSQCDIIVVILWSRMGTPVSSPRRPDGTQYESGTQREYEEALNNGKGPVLVFRRLDKPQIDLDDADYDEKRDQYNKVKSFFASFTDRDGQIRHSSHEYTGVECFRAKFQQSFEGLLRRLSDEARKQPAQPEATVTPVPPELLRSVCAKLETVGGYKDIHDQLHELENQCYDCLVRNVDRLDEESQRWDEILVHVDTLLEIACRIREYALKLQQYPQARIAAVQTCFELWQAGATARDVGKLKECRKKMAQLLALQPGYVVAELNRAATVLLPEMIRLNELRRATAGEPDQQLEGQVAHHDTWQRLRDLLNNSMLDTLEADAWWPEVESLSDSILAQSTDRRDAGFRAALQKLKDAMTSPTPESTREGLMRLRHQTKLAFHRADTDLKSLLDDLRRHVDRPCAALGAL